MASTKNRKFKLELVLATPRQQSGREVFAADQLKRARRKRVDSVSPFKCGNLFFRMTDADDAADAVADKNIIGDNHHRY